MFPSLVWWLALRRWGGQTELAPSSTGQVEQGMIALHNKNAEIVIFDCWTLPVHLNILLSVLLLLVGADRESGVDGTEEGAAAHGNTTSAGVLPKP